MLLEASVAHAFPPYRSTDAETADPWDLEGRLGFIRFTGDEGESIYATPLVRINFGLPQRVELTGEFEYLPVEGRVGDAAAGAKWVPYFHDLSLGIEVLALLPISSEGGAGVESSLLATQRWEWTRLHLNAGGFYDARPTLVEKGWRAGLLGEIELGRFRPGVELFAKQVVSEPVAIQGGGGVIVKLGPIDLRTGAHAGLTNAAPDFVASFWIAGKLSFAETD
ncbi:MAG TPA: hypothetical protein VFZ53_29355 [Polyangiaceae bacterium]